MDETLDMKRAKDRSPGFPFISLERAIERARQFYAEERRSVAPFARAVLPWKYSDTSSGALQTVAALKGYGLMDELGGTGKARQLQLSEIALRIILDQRSDSLERLQFIRRAARTPSVAAEVYDLWSGRLPGDETLNHFLVLERKFTESSAASVVRILKENHVFAMLDAEEEESSSLQKQEDSVLRQEVLIPASSAKDLTVRPSVGEALPVVNVQPQRPTHEVVPVGGSHHLEKTDYPGDPKTAIAIQFSDAPTVDVWDYLVEFATFKAAAMRKRAVPQRADVVKSGVETTSDDQSRSPAKATQEAAPQGSSEGHEDTGGNRRCGPPQAL